MFNSYCSASFTAHVTAIAIAISTHNADATTKNTVFSNNNY